jgi:hypothetical protein
MKLSKSTRREQENNRMTIRELTSGIIHPSYIGGQVMLKPIPPSRKSYFVGWLYAETEKDFTLHIPEKFKRKYKDHAAIFQPSGYYKFPKDGTMYVQEG